MKIVIKKSEIKGNVRAPPSKSYTHRAVIAAALSDGLSIISNPLICDDTLATIEGCKRLGIKILNKKNKLEIIGSKKISVPETSINCRKSGTTLRLLTAICTLCDEKIILTGDESLLNRPMDELVFALRELGAKCNVLKDAITVEGKLKGGKINLKGNISSQFLSALLLSCPKAENETKISITTDLESKPYIEMTLDTLNKFKINIETNNDMKEFIIKPQNYTSTNYNVEGDFSSAAFMLAAGAVAGKVTVKNLNMDSKQGDKKIIDILKAMGAKVSIKNDNVTVEKSNLHSTEIDIKDSIDLGPICVFLATQASGTTIIKGIERLKIKESDRAEAIITELKKMGANIEKTKDSIIVKGPISLSGAIIDPHDDHRIAMACAVAGLVANGKTIINDIECINKSYPEFINDIKKIGGNII